MTQLIIFANSKGGVSVCVPTGELPIETVLGLTQDEVKALVG